MPIEWYIFLPIADRKTDGQYIAIDYKIFTTIELTKKQIQIWKALQFYLD